MISGVHLILFTRAAEETRAFLRDALNLRGIDAGDGWLIFATPPAEIAVHPSDEERHELYLMCDDLATAMAELRSRGATFGDVREASWGRLATMTIPGGATIGVYQPTHPRP